MSGSDSIPVELLFSAPHFSRAQISPDGSRIAYLSTWSDRQNILVRDIDGLDAKPRRLTADVHRNIKAFCWTPDSTAILYVQDTNGNENWHLHRTAVADDEPRSINLTPFPGVRVMEFAFSAADPSVIFLQMNARHPAIIDLHRLNIDTGDLETLAENPGRFVRWLAIPGGSPHAIIVNTENNYELTCYDNGKFFPIATFDGNDNPLGPLPCIPTPDGKGLWIGSNRGTDRTWLARVDLATGHESEVDSHPVFDLDTPRPEADPRFPPSLILNPVTGALLGARYLGERQVIHALDPNFSEVLAKLSALSDAEPGYISCDAIGKRWLVEFTNDRDLGTTWLYDHATGKKKIVGRRQPSLAPDLLASL